MSISTIENEQYITWTNLFAKVIKLFYNFWCATQTKSVFTPIWNLKKFYFSIFSCRISWMQIDYFIFALESIHIHINFVLYVHDHLNYKAFGLPIFWFYQSKLFMRFLYFISVYLKTKQKQILIELSNKHFWMERYKKL